MQGLRAYNTVRGKQGGQAGCDLWILTGLGMVSACLMKAITHSERV